MMDIKKTALADIIKYLRKMEAKEGMEGESEDKPSEGLDLMKIGMDQDEKAPGEEDADMRLDLEEPDLDLEEEKDDSDAMTPLQEKMRDFFNNKRPKSDRGKGSKTFFAGEMKASIKPAQKGKK